MHAYTEPLRTTPLYSGFELPKALYVEDEAFSVENDLVTPTFKMRRPQLLKKYTQQASSPRGLVYVRGGEGGAAGAYGCGSVFVRGGGGGCCCT